MSMLTASPQMGKSVWLKMPPPLCKKQTIRSTEELGNPDGKILCGKPKLTLTPTLFTDMTIGEIMPLKNKLSNNRQLFCRNKDCADTFHRHYPFLPANSTCFSLSNGWLFVAHGSSHIIRYQASSSPLSGLAPRPVFAVYNPLTPENSGNHAAMPAHVPTLW